MSLDTQIQNNQRPKENNFKKEEEMRVININGIQSKKYTRNYIKTRKYSM